MPDEFVEAACPREVSVCHAMFMDLAADLETNDPVQAELDAFYLEEE